MALRLRVQPVGTIPTPIANTCTIFMDSDGVTKVMDVNRAVVNLIDVTSKAEWRQVATYAAMLALPAVTSVTDVYVAVDSNKGLNDTLYRIFPNGIRFWVDGLKDN